VPIAPVPTGVIAVLSGMTKRLPYFLALLIALPLAAYLLADDARDAERLAEALQLHPGMTVAEIGAGSGELTVAIASVVGPSGRVFSTELDKSRLETIRRAAASLPQVTVLEAGILETNLPESCCDAIFMRDVYHHFTDAAAMNQSLLRSLKPGGKLAIYDFPPRNGNEAGPRERGGSTHGITFKTLEAELKQAGFTHVLTDDTIPGRNFLVVVQKSGR
jgi:ubiquinone/menaquinone biosynthesis C-methylase UbiE